MTQHNTYRGRDLQPGEWVNKNGSLFTETGITWSAKDIRYERMEAEDPNPFRPATADDVRDHGRRSLGRIQGAGGG